MKSLRHPGSGASFDVRGSRSSLPLLADGTLLGARDVALPPLGMTQLSRVGALLGAPDLHGGRLAVSTRTPGGTVAAGASVIDNTTNDPRTLLPR